MEAKLIAHTHVNWDWEHELTAGIMNDYSPHFDLYQPGMDVTRDADELAEIAGRLCYKSWTRPNPATSTNVSYLENILNQKHFSVLEHASATFWISDVSRSLTHELVRHRHGSFSQVSQRYVDESEGGYVTHPALVPYGDKYFYQGDEGNPFSPTIGDVLHQHNRDSRRLYHDLVEKMVSDGVDRKTARGAARGVLPNSVHTEIIITGNHRTWRELLSKRLGPGADQEIKDLAAALLPELKRIAPNTYQDMELT